MPRAIQGRHQLSIGLEPTQYQLLRSTADRHGLEFAPLVRWAIDIGLIALLDGGFSLEAVEAAKQRRIALVEQTESR